MNHSRTVILDQKKHVRLVLDTEMIGCGRRVAGLTFYYLREEVRVKEGESWRFACGRGAATTSGWPGVLLCKKCALNYGLAH